MNALNLSSLISSLKQPCSLLRAFVAALIVLVIGQSGEARHADSVPVFHCSFGDDWDINYDGWPDRWIRQMGIDYPHYVKVAIEEDATAADKRCLSMELDGAAAGVASPSIRVVSRFSYVFQAQIRNENLNHSKTIVTVDFCDASGRVLQSSKSEPTGSTNGWQLVRIGPIEPRDPAIDHAVLSLEVVRGAKGDLRGRVSLADVWLERLPRIDVSTNNPCNVYADLNGVLIECALSGIRERDPEIHFQLLDGSNNELQNETFHLNGQLIVDKTHRADEQAGDPEGYEGRIRWQPKIPDYGFYRVAVQMMSAEAGDAPKPSERQLGSRTVDLVVVPPLEMPRQGEFGWTLPDGDRPLSFQELSRLLPHVGINWVKVPVWFDVNEPRRGDELIRFVELLGASNIDVVGIVDRPPSKPGVSVPRDMTIADVLSQDPAIWSAALEPVMSRLALRVRWWQLGRDYDTSLITSSTLNKRISDLRTALFRFGQDVRMGLCADWESADAHTGNVSWDFMQVASQSKLSGEKFNELLSRPRQNSAQRWIVVDLPSATDSDAITNQPLLSACAPGSSWIGGAAFRFAALVQAECEAPQQITIARTARASAFVHRLVAAKLRGADAIIIAKPFDDENGLMSRDGMPAELLLPWRTTAAMLGGGQYLGQMQLPEGSENRIFLRPDGQVVMVAWNPKPTREVLYLGNNVQQFDLLGRSTPAEQKGREQVIEVGPTPIFILGLHEAVTRWRMNVQFETNQVPSIFSKPHHNSLKFKNYFPQGIGGSVKIVVLQDQNSRSAAARTEGTASGFTLDRWSIEPPQTAFQLAADAETSFAFDIKLKNALYGKQPVRLDFVIDADERLEFSVYRVMEVGTADLTLDVRSYLDKDGTLIVEQRMTNRTDRLADFKCHLRSKGHQPQRMQVYRLGRETDRKVYRIADGADLIGKEMLLEIEELNGPRILNYRFVARDDPRLPEEPKAGRQVTSQRKGKPESESEPPPLANLGS